MLRNKRRLEDQTEKYVFKEVKFEISNKNMFVLENLFPRAIFSVYPYQKK
jgi:hypothetical protein